MPSWSELMASTAITRSGEKMSAVLRQVVEKTGVRLTVGTLRPNVAGELRRVARISGDEATVIESEITVNKDVMNEDRRVIAAILAHEVTHAGQPIVRSDGEMADCLQAEVEAYTAEAVAWSAFWEGSARPGQTKWERSMNYVVEVWKDGGESALKRLVSNESGMDAHSCVG